MAISCRVVLQKVLVLTRGEGTRVNANWLPRKRFFFEPGVCLGVFSLAGRTRSLRCNIILTRTQTTGQRLSSLLGSGTVNPLCNGGLCQGEGAEEKFKRISEAYDVLHDAQKRKNYAYAIALKPLHRRIIRECHLQIR